MDYYGFPPESYQLKFKSRGDKALAEKIVGIYKDVRAFTPSITLLTFFIYRLVSRLVLLPDSNRAARTAVDLKAQVLTMASLYHFV